jgi:hypothetical protein
VVCARIWALCVFVFVFVCLPFFAREVLCHLSWLLGTAFPSPWCVVGILWVDLVEEVLLGLRDLIRVCELLKLERLASVLQHAVLGQESTATSSQKALVRWSVGLSLQREQASARLPSVVHLLETHPFSFAYPRSFVRPLWDAGCPAAL